MGCLARTGRRPYGLVSRCWRVLDDHGVLIFKWSEAEISVKTVLDLFTIEPLFGHTTGRGGKTKWMCFMKIPGEDLI